MLLCLPRPKKSSLRDRFVFRPGPGFFGTDTFGYTDSDGVQSSGTATMTLTVNQVIPTSSVGRAVVLGVHAGQTLNLAAPGLLNSASDADGDPLTASLASGPSHGSARSAPMGISSPRRRAALTGRTLSPVR